MTNVIRLPGRAARAYDAHTSIGVIIQARMTSNRFPGKSLALLNEKPVIQHVVERAKLIRGPIKIKKPVKIIVAVPDTPESEPLLHLITNKLGVDNFCGPEHNVLERYMGAANFFKLDIIMRITGDCPLIDPKVCSEVLQLLLWRKVDYASNIYPERTFPQGLDCEVFTYDALEVAYVENKYNFNSLETHQKLELEQLRYDQEHVTPFMQRTDDFQKALVKKVENGLFDDQSKLNYCVDYPGDIKRLEKIIKSTRPKPRLITSVSNDK